MRWFTMGKLHTFDKSTINRKLSPSLRLKLLPEQTDTGGKAMQLVKDFALWFVWLVFWWAT